MAMMTGTYTKVTKSNLEQARNECVALDQAHELEPGCETWGILLGSQRGQMTRWANGRGAVMTGGDSAWGDWVDVGRDGNKAEILAADDGETWFDDNGESVCKHGYSLRSDASRDCDCITSGSQIDAAVAIAPSGERVRLYRD